jgi:hypothetical protein
MNRPLSPYPPPPDVEPADDGREHAPIKFVPQGGGVVARMGVVDCGIVRPNHGGRQFYWASYLPGGPQAGKGVMSIELGMALLADHIRDWFGACGIELPRGRP